MYGREARYPSEIPEKCQISDERVHALAENEDVCIQTKSLKDVYAKVDANRTEGQARVRKRKLSKGEDDCFVVGDQVLRKNIRQEQRKGGKLETDLLGPFTITNIDGKRADLKTRKGNTIERINIDHLKKYVEPQPRIPAKWIGSTSPALQPSPLRSPGVPQSPTFTMSPQSGPLSSSLQSWDPTAREPSTAVSPED
ncbi:hypothetical protein GJAV_G00268370 [Gymnothorax javanicus]|nr:hypothetical protein GJAV_G00268370 [Gymnothorax javanicus]